MFAVFDTDRGISHANLVSDSDAFQPDVMTRRFGTQIVENGLTCRVGWGKMGIAGKMGHVDYSNEWPMLPAMPISPHPTLHTDMYTGCLKTYVRKLMSR